MENIKDRYLKLCKTLGQNPREVLDNFILSLETVSSVSGSENVLCQLIFEDYSRDEDGFFELLELLTDYYIYLNAQIK